MLLRCAHCGSRERSLFLHHGQLFCAMCLMADDRDDMAVRVRIAILHAEAAREQTKRLRRR